MTKKKVFSVDNTKEICNLYNTGECPFKIARKFDVSETVIRRVLKENNIKTRNYSETYKMNFSPPHEEEICNLYKKGISISKITKQFSIGTRVIKRALIRNNIKIVGRSESAKIYIVKKRKEVSEKIQKQICELYNTGLNYTEISRSFGISRSYVKLILNKNNINIRVILKTKITEDIENKTCELYKNRKKFKEISKSLNISILSVKKILNKNNIELRSISEACKGRNAWNKRDLSYEEETKICNMYKEGYIISDLCDKFNTNVTKILNKNNIPIRKNFYYKSGEKSSFWQGGISFGIYCPKFNSRKKEEIRNKYYRKCIICNKLESENLTKTGKIWRLSVHHIDYNKQQGCENHEWRLVPLCLKCHSKTTLEDHEFWEIKIKKNLYELDIQINISNFFSNLFIL